jgi:protoheme IX farnesyltransferase
MREKRSRGKALTAIVELSKVRITIAVTLSTLVGYILYAGTLDAAALWTALGVFLLASSSSALNQYQERHTDAMMRRTRNRPLPSGRIGVVTTFIVVAVMFAAGSLVLYMKAGLLSLGLGLLSFAWYNGIYTPLKYRTIFALIIGSVIGAIPPVIGWTAAGGDITAIPVLFLAFFIYVWQVPHFILLLLLYGDDYRKAGLPALTTLYPETSVRRIIFVWISGTMVAGIMLPFMVGTHFWITAILVMASSVALALYMLKLVLPVRNFRAKPAFIVMNLYLIWVLVIVAVDQLLEYI